MEKCMTSPSLSTALKELDKMSYDVDDEDLKNEPVIAFSDARSLLTTFAENLLKEAREATRVDKMKESKYAARNAREGIDQGFNFALSAVDAKWEEYLSKKGA